MTAPSTLPNTNLLMGDTSDIGGSTPVAGLTNVVAWYGGELSVVVSGNFGIGNTITLLACARIPAPPAPTVDTNGINTEIEYSPDPSSVNTNDWVELEQFAAPGRYQAHVNPCWLTCRVATTDATGSIRASVA